MTYFSQNKLVCRTNQGLQSVMRVSTNVPLLLDVQNTGILDYEFYCNIRIGLAKAVIYMCVLAPSAKRLIYLEQYKMNIKWFWKGIVCVQHNKGNGNALLCDMRVPSKTQIQLQFLLALGHRELMVNVICFSDWAKCLNWLQSSWNIVFLPVNRYRGPPDSPWHFKL